MSLRAAKNGSNYVLAFLLFLYSLGRVFQLFPGKISGLIIVIFHVVPVALFALIHGSRTYKPRTILVFVCLCLGVGAGFEISSLRTGFPFGHYEFTSLMGPKFFGLPVFLALAYLGMGYASWVVALSILKCQRLTLRGRELVLVPLMASFAMVVWDLSMDPVWANIDRAWIWKDGGAWFGVPLSNFLGWYLTVYVFYQLFALYLRGEAVAQPPAAHWKWAILLYAFSAAGNLLVKVPGSMPRVVVDASGRSWTVSAILWAMRLISVFVMLPIAGLAWARISPHTADPQPLIVESRYQAVAEPLK